MICAEYHRKNNCCQNISVFHASVEQHQALAATSDMLIYIYDNGFSVLPLTRSVCNGSFWLTLICQIVFLMYLFLTFGSLVPLTIVFTVKVCYIGDNR